MDSFMPVPHDCSVPLHPCLASIQRKDYLDKVAQVQSASSGKLLHAGDLARARQDCLSDILFRCLDRLLDSCVSTAPFSEVSTWYRTILDQCGADLHNALQHKSTLIRKNLISSDLRSHRTHLDPNRHDNSCLGGHMRLHYLLDPDEPKREIYFY